MCSAVDLAAVDNLQSSAWDYACMRQLHYCMLIIASYLRQRNNDVTTDVHDAHCVKNDVDSGVQYGPFSEDLGIDSLQVSLAILFEK